MKQLTIQKDGITTHGPSQFTSDVELQEHLARHEAMGSYGEIGTYEALIEDVIDTSEQDSINAEAKAYLSSTDYLIIREIDSGVPCPAEIKEARQAARDRII